MTVGSYLIFITASLFLLACQVSQINGSQKEEIINDQYVVILDHIRTDDPSAIFAFKWNGQAWTELSGSKPVDLSIVESKKWVTKDTPEAPVGLKFEGCNFKKTTWLKSPLYCIGSKDIVVESEPSSLFSGWSSTSVPRPIVFVQNKKGVKIFSLDATQSNKKAEEMAKNEFMNQNKFAYNCPSMEMPRAVKSQVKVSHKNIKLISQFSLGKDGEIITIQLDHSLLKCDGPPEDPWFTKTYLVSPDKTIKFLGNSLVPLEAGDFVGDGKIEVIFFFSGYNEDGYILYFDHFSKSEKFSWHYH